jgi:hypothetical protein
MVPSPSPSQRPAAMPHSAMRASPSAFSINIAYVIAPYRPGPRTWITGYAFGTLTLTIGQSSGTARLRRLCQRCWVALRPGLIHHRLIAPHKITGRFETPTQCLVVGYHHSPSCTHATGPL